MAFSDSQITRLGLYGGTRGRYGSFGTKFDTTKRRVTDKGEKRHITTRYFTRSRGI